MKKFLNILLGAVAFELLFQVYGYGQVAPGPDVTIQSVFGPPPGGIPVGGPGLSTDYALAAWNGVGGNLLRNTTLITDANGDLTMPSTATNGFRLYGTADQTTDYSRLNALFSGAVYWIHSDFGGIGTAYVPIRLQVGNGTGGTTYSRLTINRASGPLFDFVRNGDFSNAGTNLGMVASFSNAVAATNPSGTINYVSITPTYNQSASTAANTDLLVNRTETAVGSGAQNLLDLQVATVSRFSVSNNGLVRVAPGSGNAFINMVSGGSAVFQYSSNDRMIFSAFQTSFSYPNASTSTSGSITAFSITPLYNQASGNAANTDLLVNRTETAVGSGTQLFADFQVGGTSKLTIRNTGEIRSAGTLILSSLSGSAGINLTHGGTNRLVIAPGSGAVTATFGPDANTSGTIAAFSITPSYNQASGNAANTDLLINRTQTAVGSGTQLLIDAQVGGVSKFKVDNGGGTTASAFYANNYNSSSGPITITGTGANSVTIQTNSTTALTIDSSQNAQFAKKVTSYNGVSTAGMGVDVVVANPRQTAVTNTTATLATYTVPASDSTYRISANVQVTAATTAAMTVVCTYTDETNTVRAQTIPFVQLAGTFLTSITNVTGTGPYEGATLQIRCKASTTIVFTTTGTVTGITYNVEGLVIQDS